ncbi:MAG: sulfotransferase [Hyphomonadaceae bacterium]
MLNRQMPNPSQPGARELASALAAAGAHVAAGRYREGHAACMAVLQAAPNSGEAYLLLAVIAGDHGNHVKAVELLDRSAGLSPRPVKALALAFKAKNLTALNRRADAIAAAEASEALDPRDAQSLDTLGVVYTRAGMHARAAPFYERAAAIQGTPGQFYNLGAALQFLGRFDEARAAYRKCIAKAPHHAQAWSSLTQITRATPESNDIPALEATFAARSNDWEDGLNIGHALAKSYEDIGDPASAMAWLERGKAKRRAAQPYRADFDRELFQAAMRSASLPPAAGYREAAPIFVVGMPRTGTTLVDRILSSHSEVTSAGELSDFTLVMKRMAKTPSPYVLDAETLDTAAGLDAAALGEAYVQQVRATLNLTGRFVDKMPLNVFVAAHILRALPDARVICMRRHPADTVLANYRQLFSTQFSYYAYAFSLEDTARYFVLFDRMVRAFEQALPPDRFRVVSYEDLVVDFEPGVRSLLDFCGLTFEQACLDFHENAAPVATASAAQVRQPLYTSALARWKRYRPALDPAIRILVDAGCMSVDEAEG